MLKPVWKTRWRASSTRLNEPCRGNSASLPETTSLDDDGRAERNTRQYPRLGRLRRKGSLRINPISTNQRTKERQQWRDQYWNGRASKLPTRRAKHLGRHLPLQMRLKMGVTAARRAAKQGGDAAEELFDDTAKRLQRHPIETVVATFAIGVGIGVLIGWLVKRR